jgi:hypothetical protein
MTTTKKNLIVIFVAVLTALTVYKLAVILEKADGKYYRYFDLVILPRRVLF